MNQGFQLMQPYWIGLLLPFWLYLFWWLKQPLKRSDSLADATLTANNHYYHPLVKQLSKTAEFANTKQPLKTQSWGKFWWLGSAISALIFSLAQPVIMGERLPDPPAERDIVFLVDTSVSMQLKDYSLDGKPIKRMDLLRKLLNEFTVKMSGESISVIVFAEQAYTLVPLSSDQALIRRQLSRVTTTLAGRYTAVGDALLLALKEANKQKQRHQTFILFTDADDSLGKVTPQAAAQLVAENGIPIFTVAIGSAQQDKTKAVSGGLYQSVNLDLLKNLAEITGAKSYQANDSNTVKKALKDILQQRQNKAPIIPRYERESLYLYPLLFGLGLLLLWQLSRLVTQRVMRSDA